MTDATTALGYAQEHAAKAWDLFTQSRNFTSAIPDWQVGISPDGSPTLSVQVVGPGAAHALKLFTADYYVVLGAPGDQRPAVDYGTPGRVACVWRKFGVWIELWHPDGVSDAPESPQPVLSAPVPSATVQADPGPAPESSSPSPTQRRRALLGPGGRLTFTRKQRTTDKETTTR